jgi:outer membrane protein OmpA-like peptidoglycan-associated protein
MDDVRGNRRETRQGNRTVIREPGRTIVREGDRTIVRHNEADRFRIVAGRNARTERRGNETVTVIERPGGVRIVTVVDSEGRLIRRSRRGRDGREVVIIDNRRRGPPRQGVAAYYVDVPPPPIRIPRTAYWVAAAAVGPAVVYETLTAPPVARVPRAYTLDEVRYNANVRARMRRVDLDGINFETGSWEIAPDQVERLAGIAEAVRRAVEANPNEVFLIEGHPDAVGSDVDNLSLSDRRAEAVAIALTEQFQIPPENLTTQGYGEQHLKVETQGSEPENRRVTVVRITPLLTGNNAGVEE